MLSAKKIGWIGEEGKGRNEIKNCWVTIISQTLFERKWWGKGLIDNHCLYNLMNSMI